MLLKVNDSEYEQGIKIEPNLYPFRAFVGNHDRVLLQILSAIEYTIELTNNY